MKRSTARSVCIIGPKTHTARRFVVVGIVALLLSSSTWSAQQAGAGGLALVTAGDLDPTFGIGGKVTTDFVDFGAIAFGVVIQNDGKIVTAGIIDDDFGLMRYNTNGTLDIGFGTGGTVATDFFKGPSAALAIAMQADGKFVAAGSTFDVITNAVDFALARYNPDGSLDPSFGAGGKVTTDFGGNLDQAFALAIQRDGKIVAAGDTFFQNSGFADDFALARYNPDGSLDTSFGTAGRVVTDFFGVEDQAFSVVIQTDGKIVAAGGVSEIVGDRGFDYAGLARYNSDGSLDTSFGSDGKVTTGGSVSHFVFRFKGMALQPDGKIVAAGSGFLDQIARLDFALVRYNADGGLDSTFGTGGMVFTNFFGEEYATSVVVQSDGGIVVAGTTGNYPPMFDNNFAVARYNIDGGLDQSFGTGGRVVTDFFGDDTDGDICYAVALQRDGKILAGGVASKNLGGGSGVLELALARYNGRTFDICLQDDSNGNVLLFNSTAGDYQFTDCRKDITLFGKGRVTNNACKVTLQDNGPTPKRPDRSVLVEANRCTRTARATIVIFSTGASFGITDSDFSNNTCACR